ncbi:hypothetical protein HDU83_006451 [Entophlyctis luteolus]|nr:hypothetical protein HDU83_006451 [Entophlyctis luteolus]
MASAVAGILANFPQPPQSVPSLPNASSGVCYIVPSVLLLPPNIVFAAPVPLQKPRVAASPAQKPRIKASAAPAQDRDRDRERDQNRDARERTPVSPSLGMTPRPTTASNAVQNSPVQPMALTGAVGLQLLLTRALEGQISAQERTLLLKGLVEVPLREIMDMQRLAVDDVLTRKPGSPCVELDKCVIDFRSSLPILLNAPIVDSFFVTAKSSRVDFRFVLEPLDQVFLEFNPPMGTLSNGQRQEIQVTMVIKAPIIVKSVATLELTRGIRQFIVIKPITAREAGITSPNGMGGGLTPNQPSALSRAPTQPSQSSPFGAKSESPVSVPSLPRSPMTNGSLSRENGVPSMSRPQTNGGGNSLSRIERQPRQGSIPASPVQRNGDYPISADSRQIVRQNSQPNPFGNQFGRPDGQPLTPQSPFPTPQNAFPNPQSPFPNQVQQPQVQRSVSQQPQLQQMQSQPPMRQRRSQPNAAIAKLLTDSVSDAIFPQAQHQTPKVLSVLRTALMAIPQALSTPGIFREKGSDAEAKMIRDKLARNATAGALRAKDPLAISTCIKQIFREMPAGMHLCNEIPAQVILETRDMRQAYQAMQRSMSPQVRDILEWVLDLIIATAALEGSNGMGVRALCTVWAPNLLSVPEGLPMAEANSFVNVLIQMVAFLGLLVAKRKIDLGV